MSGHDKHASCEHQVHWCRHCDVAYCDNCEMYWDKPCRQMHGLGYQAQWRWQPPYYAGINTTPDLIQGATSSNAQSTVQDIFQAACEHQERTR